MDVAQDGSGPFDADNVPGNDSDASNGVVRTQDTVLYTINYSASDISSSVITATLPAGMRWDASATAATVCNDPGGGSLNAARTVLTCNRQPASAGVESFQVLSWVGNVANGATVALTAASGASSAVSDPVTVSATPKTDTRVRVDPANIVRAETTPGSGIWQRRMPLGISLGALLPASGNFKGYEALQNPVSVTIKVQPGTVVTNCPASLTCLQPGGPGADVTVQITNPITHFLDAAAPFGFEAAWRQTAAVLVQIGVPEIPNFPVGTTSFITAQLSNFAPLGLSGQANAVPAPGYQPGFSCPANTSVNRSQTCVRTAVNRNQPVQLNISGGAVYNAASHLYGDGHGYAQAFEKVLPGQTFNALMGLANRSISEDVATDAQSCVAWNPALLELRAPASLKQGRSSIIYLPGHSALPDVAAADRVLEYSAQPYADDNARRAAHCGVAGDGNVLWVSDYTSLPANTITSVRYAYRNDLPPGQTLGLVLPLQRSTSAVSLALADDAPLPWFLQYFTDSSGRVYSTFNGNSSTSGASGGGYVQAAAALARHRIALPASVEPGDIFPISIAPTTIGAATAGVNGASRNVQIALDFPNTYIQPLENSIAPALPPGATYVLTPANLGADGLPGTADDGAPAKLVLSLGDLAAPGGSAGPDPYQGHATAYPAITFQAQAAYIAPVGAYPLVGLITANNDPSFGDYTGVGNNAASALLQDRTERASTVVSGVPGFQMSKALVSGGTVDNTDPANPVTRITAGEPFTYAISFGNATSTAKGQLRMVDVLPFDGDTRGTTGLGPLRMLSATAAMGGAGQGSITIEYTTTAAATVQAAVQTPGNEDAAAGVAWTAYTSGAFPAGVTAMRFTSTSLLQPSFSGIANLAMRTTLPLTPSTQLFNDVYSRELSPGGLVLVASNEVALRGQAAASFTGQVFNDVNMNNTLDAGEAGIAGVTAAITCDAGPACTAGEVHTAVTDGSGVYRFAPGATVDGQANFPGLASGLWTLRIDPDAQWIHGGATVGTVNGAPSGTAVGRSISGIVVPAGAVAVDYLFAEHQLGSLTINKALALPAGVAGPFDFAFTATCDLPAANSVYPATLTGYPTTTSVTIDQLPEGANCVVTEDQPLPTAPASYEWAAPTVPAMVVVPGNAAAAVTVTNALNPLLGSITVTKDLVLPADVPGPFNFSYTATCDLPSAGSVYSATLDYPAMTAATIANVPAGAQCVVAEGALPAAPANYTWGPAAANVPVTVSLNASAPVSMASTLVRLQAGIEVTKTLVLPSGVTGPFSFGFTATCNLPSAGSVYSAALANYPTNTRVTIPGIPSGASCAVTENTPLPTAPNGYEWAAPSVPAPVTVPASGVASVAVTNALNQQLGTITINKTLTLPSGVTGPFNFTYTATCDLPSAGTVFPASLTYPTATSATIANVPAGAQCVVAEGALPAAPTNFNWGPAAANATVTVPVNSDIATTMASTLVRQQAGIEVTKTLALPSGVTGPFSFGFTATCDLPAAGTTYTATLADYPTSTKVTIANVPAGANCTVTENTPLPAAPANYEWAAPSAPAAVTVPNIGVVGVEVINRLNPLRAGNPTPVPLDSRIALLLLAMLVAAAACLKMRKR